MTTHTGLPWFTHRVPGLGMTIQSAGGWLAIMLDSPTRPAESNAEFIVAACNSFGAMYEVCRRAIGACTCHSTMRHDISCLSCAARAALAAADGADAR